MRPELHNLSFTVWRLQRGDLDPSTPLQRLVSPSCPWSSLVEILDRLKKTAQGTADEVVLGENERQDGGNCRLGPSNQQSGCWLRE